jgi:hypothetical protein
MCCIPKWGATWVYGTGGRSTTGIEEHTIWV